MYHAALCSGYLHRVGEGPLFDVDEDQRANGQVEAESHGLGNQYPLLMSHATALEPEIRSRMQINGHEDRCCERERHTGNHCPKAFQVYVFGRRV